MVQAVCEGQCTAGVILLLWVYSMGVRACNNVVACCAISQFVLLIKQTYNVD